MDPEGTTGATQPEGPAGGQPEGQGGEGLGLYDLEAAPQELRPYLEQELKKVEANVTRKFQEAADFRKQFEPLAGIEGLTDVPADELTELLEFREIASDPQKLEEWWSEIGERAGFFDDDEAGGDPDFGGDGEEGDEPPAWAKTLTDRLEALEGQVKPISDTLTEREQRERVQEAERQIESELAALEQKHGELDRDIVVRLATAYDGAEDAIERGFQDYLKVTGKAQGELVDGKLEQPAPATSGGRPDTTPEEIQGFGDPALKAAAKARFAASR